MFGTIAICLLISALFMFIGLMAMHADNTNFDERKRKIVESFSVHCKFFSAGCLVIGLCMPIIIPKYNVWQQNKEGEAELARAEQNRQIAVQEAKAKEEAAKSLANAEIIRAQGVAQANKIIGDSLQNNDAYIHYLWIEALRESDSDVIYIPTEAGIPITESARFFKKQQE